MVLGDSKEGPHCPVGPEDEEEMLLKQAIALSLEEATENDNVDENNNEEDEQKDGEEEEEELMLMPSPWKGQRKIIKTLSLTLT